MKPSLSIKGLWFTILVCLPLFTKANGDVFPVGAASQGMGNASAVLNDAWSGLQNQAGLASIDRLSFNFQYENQFLVPELSTEAFALCIPTHTGTFGLLYSFFGYAHFYESRTGLAFGKAFGDMFRAGVELNYLKIHQDENYGNLQALVPGVGIQVLPLKEMVLGFHVFNPAGQSYSPLKEEKIPVLVQAGIGYTFEDNLLLCVEVNKQSGNLADFIAGTEYRFMKLLAARVGISNGEFTSYSFGLGFHSKQLTTDISMQHHPVLGFSPAVSIGYAFK